MVMVQFCEHCFKVKWSKCLLFQCEVSYLGHVISAAGVTTDPEKIRAVTEWRCPSTLAEPQSFFGFAGYYRRFVGNFSSIAAPLRALSVLGS